MLLSLWLGGGEAVADAVYLAQLLNRADSAALAQRREWRTLLHYRPTAAGGMVSDTNDPRFFLSPVGKTDPQAELAAVLAAFFQADLVGGDPQPAQCAFIARYQWLKAELQFDDRRLPPQDCKRFQRWLQELDAEAVTLVFASAYLNNPASLFGHTFLRVDQQGQTENNRLLAPTINYAADDTHSTTLTYVLDGVSGGFKGKFAIQPYYQLVRTYSDLENRDIWEYRLNLTAPQRRRLLEHVWELREITFNYYFFRENCAWQLLTLLEVADPTLRLSDQFRLWTLPADTIRELVQQSALVGAAIARPARGATINRRYATLTVREQRLVSGLRHDPRIATTPEFLQLVPARQALLLELARDVRQYQRTANRKKKQEPAPDEITHRLSVARSRIKATATPVAIAPYAMRPEIGHASRRIGVGSGQRVGQGFWELNARASYHDLLEPDAGYAPDAQIELLAATFRYYASDERLRLERLTLLDITSLPPTNALTPRPSWRIHAGWEPVPRTNCHDCTAFNISGGLGIATETRWPWRIVWFMLPELAFEYDDHFFNDHRLGWGMETGLLARLTPGWKLLAGVTWRDYWQGETNTALRAELRQRFALERNLSLGLDWRYLEGLHEFTVGVQAYF